MRMFATALERLRGASKPWIYAAVALAALAALLLLNRQPAPAGERQPLEVRLEQILSEIDGAGSVSAMIAQDGEGAVTGVLVVCGGSVTLRTALRMQQAVQTLLGVDLDRISVIGAEDGAAGP